MRVSSRIFLSFLVFLSAALMPRLAQAHSGGTDKNGCHGGSQAYHCHSGSATTSTYKRMLKINGLDKNYNFRTTLKRYSSCSTLNRVYFRGVRKRAAKSTDFRQYVSSRLYSMNKHLDANLNGVACGFLESENARVATIACALDASLMGDGIKPETAYRCVMPPQPVEETGGGWKVELLSRTPDAGLAIESVSIDDSRPPAGSQHYLVTIRVTNLTGKTSDFPTRLLGAFGESGRKYDFDDGCPASWLGLGKPLFMSATNVPDGKSVVGNECWTILASDALGLKVTIKTQRDCKCNMYTVIDRTVFISF